MRIPSSPSYLRLVRASAWYDIAATAAFATPWTFAAFHDAMNGLALALGAAPLPGFDPIQTLFANLLGSVVLVWAAVRLWRTQAAYGAFDGVARVLFAAWQAMALHAGASVLLWPFLIVEIGFGVAQWWPIIRAQGGTPGPRAAPRAAHPRA